MTGYTSSAEKEKPTTKISLPSKDLIQILRRNQKLYRQAKAERFSTTKPDFQQMLNDFLYTGNTVKAYKDEPKTTK